jgi:hypothetical protein
MYTEQGRLEHRLPLLQIAMPKWIGKQHPQLRANLRANQDRLITAFDINKTLKHVLTYPASPSHTPSPYARSLFDEISPRRRCKDAYIPEYLCACTPWAPIFLMYPSWFPPFAQAILDSQINVHLRPNGTLERCRTMNCTVANLTETIPGTNCEIAQSTIHYDAKSRPLNDKTNLYWISFPVGYAATFDMILSAPVSAGMPGMNPSGEWLSPSEVNLISFHRSSVMGQDARARFRPPAGMSLEYCIVSEPD